MSNSFEPEISPQGSASDINVDEIMAQVREKVRQSRQAAQAEGLESRSFVFDDYPNEAISDTYDADLYAHLRQVNQPHQILGVRRVMRSSVLSRWPIFGSIWQQIQRQVHDLVIFYANALAGEVVGYQRHVAGVLNRLVGWSQAKDNEIALLQQEIQRLKERIETIENKQ